MYNKVIERGELALNKAATPANPDLPKTATGIQGLDQITGGGLPRGRPTLVCGGPGSGKTLLGLEFLVRGAQEFDEPGVLMSFEETAGDVIQNVAALGWDLQALIDQKKFLIDYVYLERSEIQETGEFDLEGLFIRLDLAIRAIGAKRVVLDTLETLFAGFTHEGILRAEIRRLFRWLKEKGVTAVITGEPGHEQLTRYGLEEYISDCVILLSQRMQNQLATRRLQVLKYRGTAHGTNEFPFLINQSGLVILPITSLGLDHAAPTERISSGIAALDEMLEGQGYYRGSNILISGTAGSGKSSMAAYFADATCRRGESCLYLAFEESVSQIIRNMGAIGLDLAPWQAQNLLHFYTARPSQHGL
ncbi:MAG: circadian clock protein KaiC, partial [Anaerolineae bacterium]|nr:circadian clock protein KaiC [Anaerolineae bacterium]